MVERLDIALETKRVEASMQRQRLFLKRGRLRGVNPNWEAQCPQWFKDMVAESYRPKHWQLRLPGF